MSAFVTAHSNLHWRMAQGLYATDPVMVDAQRDYERASDDLDEYVAALRVSKDDNEAPDG